MGIAKALLLTLGACSVSELETPNIVETDPPASTSGGPSAQASPGWPLDQELNPLHSLAPDSLTNQCAEGAGSPCVGSKNKYLQGQDGDYRIRVPSYTATEQTVLDSVTGFLWQRTPSTEVFASHEEAAAYCKNLSLEGQTGWHLPSRLELVTLLDVAGDTWEPSSTCTPAPVVPALASTANVNNINSWNECLWTSSSRNNVTAVVCGCIVRGWDFIPPSPLPARCVLGDPGAPDLSVSPGGATVLDRRTGLLWQRQGNGPSQIPLLGCESLTLEGWSDWRLPSLKELSSLIDDRFLSGLDPQVFPGDQAGFYQSSSLALSPIVTNAWGVTFGPDSGYDLGPSGFTGSNAWGLLRYRCVRN